VPQIPALPYITSVSPSLGAFVFTHKIGIIKPNSQELNFTMILDEYQVPGIYLVLINNSQSSDSNVTEIAKLRKF
jgi:hypothetical protein